MLLKNKTFFFGISSFFGILMAITPIRMFYVSLVNPNMNHVENILSSSENYKDERSLNYNEKGLSFVLKLILKQKPTLKQNSYHKIVNRAIFANTLDDSKSTRILLLVDANGKEHHIGRPEYLSKLIDKRKYFYVNIYTIIFMLIPFIWGICLSCKKLIRRA